MPDNHEPIFLDTAYVYALVNTRDEWHKKALTWQEKLEKERRGIITTELILVEIADGLASIRFRTQAAQVIAALQSSPFVEVVAVSSELLTLALDLYRQRGDKEWGLTDCVIPCNAGARFTRISNSRYSFSASRISCFVARNWNVIS